MKTEPMIDSTTSPGGQSRPKRRSRLATTGAVLVVLLIAGISILAYARLAPRRQGQGAPSANGTWNNVLSGYQLTSLAAAPGDPAVLYACAQHKQARGVVSSASQAVLRSSDGGSHWQDIGGKAGAVATCGLTINPSNSNEVYLVTTINNGKQSSAVLKHTTDGGQTWNTILPALSIPGASTTPAWDITQLSMIGQHLFGIQTLPGRFLLQGRKGTAPRYAVYNLPRLITSSDGGHTWTALDQQFSATQQGVGDYAVDPANIATIYELVSVPRLPIQPLIPEPNGTIPALGYNAVLYKTTDGGATWQLLLKNLPFGSTVQLAANNPQIIYAGGIPRPMPLIGIMPRASKTNTTGGLQLHVSSDGGASWRDVAALPGSLYPQNWFANQNGQVYVYTGGLYLPPTVVVGTAVATTVTISTVTPQKMPAIRQPALTPPTVTALAAQIERYDPATNHWSAVTKPPTSGSLLAVTPGSGSADLLWFMGSSRNQPVLYRYTGA